MTIDAVIDEALKDKVSEVVDAVEKGRNSGIFGMCEAGGVRIRELATEVLARRDYQVLSAKMEVPRPGKDTAVTLFDGFARQIQADVPESRSFSEAVENLKRALVRRAKQRKERLVISISSFDNCRHMPDDRLGNFFYGLWEVYKLGRSGGIPVIILESTRCLTMLKSKCANIYESSDLFRDFRNVTWASLLTKESVRAVMRSVEKASGDRAVEEAWMKTYGHIGLLKLYLENDRSFDESTAQIVGSVERMLKEFRDSDGNMTWLDCLKVRAKRGSIKEPVKRCLEKYGLLDPDGVVLPLFRNYLVGEENPDNGGGGHGGRRFIRDRAMFIDDAKMNFAQNRRPMLLYGRTGSGKSRLVEELVKKLVADGKMKTSAYVSTSPDDFDAEHPAATLFGHDPRAWTGCPDKEEPGLFEQAHEGILFIDEAENIPLVLQQAMLRPLQEKKVHRVAASGQGSPVTPDPDFMPIFALNVSPDELVEGKVWRQDFKDRVAGWLDYEIKPELDSFEKVASCVEEFLKVNYKCPQIRADDLAKRCVFEYVKKYAKDEGWRQVEQLLTNLAMDVQKSTEPKDDILLTGEFVCEDLAKYEMPIDDVDVERLIHEKVKFEQEVEQWMKQMGGGLNALEKGEKGDFCELIKVVISNPQAKRDETANIWVRKLGLSPSKTGPRNRMQRLLEKIGFKKDFQEFQKRVVKKFSKGAV